jgi:murein DD-endopeptidase MepM/ murein hydrolase activator NlpD
VELEQLEAAQVAVAREGERLEAEEERLSAMLAEQQELRDAADELREHRALALAELEDELDELQREHDDLEDEEAELQATIRRIQEEEERRRQEEERRQAAAAAESTASGAVSSSGFQWPVCGPVTSEYGPRWGRMHRGIDLGVPIGTPIAASKAGTVILATSQGGYGNLVLIDHHDGVVTAYAHLSTFRVSVGDSVSQGQTIALSGNTGNSTGPHLHFETRANGTAVNPRQYLSGSPC